MTTAGFLRSIYEAGLSPAEARREVISTLFLYRQGYERRKRREEVHLIGLRNEVRSFAGGEPLDPDDLYGGRVSQDTGKDEAARHAMLRQMDLDDTEPVAPDDFDLNS